MVGTVQRKQRYYTPYEVACHNSPNDCWISCLGRVYDLTDLVRVRVIIGANVTKSLSECRALASTTLHCRHINTLADQEACLTLRSAELVSSLLFLQDNEGPLAEPILRAAGTDVSHWCEADHTGSSRVAECFRAHEKLAMR